LIDRRNGRALIIQQLFDFRGGQRTGEQVALDLIAVVVSEPGELRRRLHAFGDHLEFQGVRHTDDGEHDGGIIGIRGNSGDEDPVNLQFVQGKAAQISQAGIAGSEIIDRHSDAQVAQALQGIDGTLGVPHQGTLGHFQLE